MKKAIHLLLTIGLASVLLAGCSGNLFMQFDQVEVKSVSEIGAVDAASPSASSSFIIDVEKWLEANALSGDASTSIAVADKLDEIAASGTVDAATKQEAAMLAGIVRVDSDPNAAEVIQNITEVFTSLTDETSTPSVADVLKELIPSTVLNDDTALQSMLNTLVLSASSFLSFGSTDPATIDYTGAGTGDKGTVAQYAAVTIVLQLALANMEDTGGTAVTDGDPENVSAAEVTEFQKLFDADTGNDPTFAPEILDELNSGTATTSLGSILDWSEYGNIF